jgi:GntR family transcriptional regulator
MAPGLPSSPLVVHRASGTPVHVQIASWLRAAIAAGELSPGDRLVGERVLAERLGVSRMTLRQALSELESSSELVRVPGRSGGAFVAEPRVEVDLTHLAGLTDQVRRAGRRAGARVLVARRGVPEADAARALGLAVRAQAVEIVRIRSANGVPVGIESSWFPARLVPGFLNHTLTGSLYAVLRTHYGREPVAAEERLQAVVADAQNAERLGVAEGAPLMRVERVATDATGAAVEFARDLFRPDRVEFLVRRSPDQPLTLRALTDRH